MSPRLEDTQRNRTFLDELRAMLHEIGRVRTAVSVYGPQVIGIDDVGFNRLYVHLRDAEVAVAAAIGTVQDAEVQV